MNPALQMFTYIFGHSWIDGTGIDECLALADSITDNCLICFCHNIIIW